MREEWRPVVGFEGMYEVSDLGNVRSLDRQYEQMSRHGTLFTRGMKGRLLRPGRMPQGHLSVAIGKGNSKCVHDLVLRAFVGPPPDNHEGRHLDGDPSNNKLPNLVWSTRGDNGRDKKWHDLPVCYKLRPPQIAEIKRSLASGVGAQRLADRFDVTRTTIYAIKSGKIHRDVHSSL